MRAIRSIPSRIGRWVRQEVAAQRQLLGTRAGRVVLGGLGLLATGTIIGMVALWPGEIDSTPDDTIIISQGIQAAEVTAVAQDNCPVENTGTGCVRVGIRLKEGAQKGAASYLILPGDDAAPRLSPGDDIRVSTNNSSFSDVPLEAIGESADPSQAPYGFVDFERRASLLWLFAAFAVLVVALGRRVGLLSLIGVLISLLLITSFVVPAILEGTSPFAVALIGSFAAMFVTIALVYGLSAKCLAALLGTAAALVVTAVLAAICVEAIHITGTASEEASLVRGLAGGTVDLQGLVLAGILIGALGVLNDVTVGQAATVLALKRAAPQLKVRDLYRRGIDVGRDHLGATVNTLVLAYAGAALPLLLIFSTQDIGLSEAINRELVATEIVAALVGSIGLISAIPLTTLVAAMLAARLPLEILPEEHHGHAH